MTCLTSQGCCLTLSQMTCSILLILRRQVLPFSTKQGDTAYVVLHSVLIDSSAFLRVISRRSLSKGGARPPCSIEKS